MIRLILRWLRRLDALEERIDALETTLPIDYTMPPRYDIQLTPITPVAELPSYDGPSLEQDEDWPTGLYL